MAEYLILIVADLRGFDNILFYDFHAIIVLCAKTKLICAP